MGGTRDALLLPSCRDAMLRVLETRNSEVKAWLRAFFRLSLHAGFRV